MRFGAALLVAVGHGVQLHFYTGDFPFGVRMQHYCVTVFFVLSGLVISTSVLGGRSSLPRYAVARIARILPVAIPALVFAALAAYVLVGPMPVQIDNSPEDPLLFAERFLPPLAFVSAWPGMPAPVWNPPYWSLCYEVWYYAIFALAVFLRGWGRLVAVALACWTAGGAILLLMPVWLLGVSLTHSPLLRRVSASVGTVFLCLGLWAGWSLFEVDRDVLNPLLRELWGSDPKWSAWAIADFGMGLAMCLALVGLRPIAERLEGPILKLEGVARWLAGFSFTLYLFHWPLIQLLRSWGIEAGNSVVGFVGLLALVVALCALFSVLTERQSPRLRKWMERRFLQPSLPAAEAAAA